MKDIKVAEIENKTVGVILSSKFARHMFGTEKREGPDNEPIAVKTDFGWIIAGPPVNENEIKKSVINAMADVDEIPIEKLIQFMYRHDFIARPEEDYPPEMQHICRSTINTHCSK